LHNGNWKKSLCYQSTVLQGGGCIYIVKFTSDTIKPRIVHLLIDPVSGKCLRPKLHFNLYDEKINRDQIFSVDISVNIATAETQEWWELGHTVCCSELIAAVPKIVRSESQNLETHSLAIVNSKATTTTLLYDILRADRLNEKDDISFSLQGKKTSPGSFYSVDDIWQHGGSTLCLPKNPSHKITAHLHLAGVSSETYATGLKSYVSDHDILANESGSYYFCN